MAPAVLISKTFSCRIHLKLVYTPRKASKQKYWFPVQGWLALGTSGPHGEVISSETGIPLPTPALLPFCALCHVGSSLVAAGPAASSPSSHPVLSAERGSKAPVGATRVLGLGFSVTAYLGTCACPISNCYCPGMRRSDWPGSGRCSQLLQNRTDWGGGVPQGKSGCIPLKRDLGRH